MEYPKHSTNTYTIHYTYDEIEEELLPLSIRNVDIADLLNENYKYTMEHFGDYKKLPSMVYQCPDCKKKMPVDVKDLHKCKKNESGNNNTKTSS